MDDILRMAHRGASKLAPQNTLEAFKKAFELGARAFETDIHRTADGELVICHNTSVKATSNGKGNIRKMTLEALRSLDFGSYFSKEFAGAKIPTLEETLKLASENRDKLSVMNLELKPVHSERAKIAAETVDLVKKYNLLDKLMISSFDRKILERAKQYEPDCKTAFIYPKRGQIVRMYLFPPYKKALKIGAYAINPHYAFINAKRVQKAHELGLKVFPWTVNTPKATEKVKGYGVDGIISDEV